MKLYFRLCSIFSPYVNKKILTVFGKSICIEWTKSAEQMLQARSLPLIVEMQLYFSCLVKKRVIFHDNTELESIVVNKSISIVCRTVESSDCDPVEFANNYPVKRELRSRAARKMLPSRLQLDYKNGRWVGLFFITA